MKNEKCELLSCMLPDCIEAGCDEAGRGCLAGPVYAAAVILPPGYRNERLNDSKQLSEKQRYALRDEIIRDAMAWSIGICDSREIDNLNILRASITAMHRALDGLKILPEHVIVDGNRFYVYRPKLADGTLTEPVPHDTVVKGDGKYLSIAAASILAKTFRDDEMLRLHEEYPVYNWQQNKGYPSKAHREAIRQFGTTPYHRMSFRLLPEAEQLELQFD